MIPGFVDLQVNGYQGVAFTDPQLTAEGIARVSEQLFARGVVGYCPTVSTSPLALYERNLPLLAAAARSTRGAQIVGIHLEGPCINPADGPRGVHPLAAVAAPSIELFERLRALCDGRLALFTLAPEVEGAIPLIEHIATHTNVVVSLGHHMADGETLRRACDAGAQACTHVGNGMAEMIHRHNNPLWPMLAEDRLAGLFICDGQHLPLDMLRVCLRAKGVERFIATSDMVYFAGYPPGEYNYRGIDVVLEASGRLHRKGAHQLAGSTWQMAQCMDLMASLGELDQTGLRRIGYDNPLALLGAQIEPERLASAPKVNYDGQRFVVGGASSSGRDER